MSKFKDLQEDCTAPPASSDAWASLAAMSYSQQAAPGSTAERIVAQSRQMQEQGLVGGLMIETLNQRFNRIDLGGNGNGVIERDELTSYVRSQQRQPESTRDNLAVMGAQRALDYMSATNRDQITREEVRAGLKDGLMPEARNTQAAAKQYDDLVAMMRKINPAGIADNNQIQVGALRAAAEQNPEYFNKQQHAAIRTLLNDAPALANSNGFFNTVANFLWNGDEGRYLSPESIAARSEQLGAPSRIRLPINPTFSRTLSEKF